MGSTKIKVEEVNIEEEAARRVATGEEPEATEGGNLSPRARRIKGRSKNYVNLRSQVDKTKTYDVGTAIALVKKLTRKKHPSITADINLREAGVNFEISLPHSTGKTVKVAIADDKLLEKIGEGTIDFDVLIATPDMMGKIAKHARVLGPRGLMPNPKNKTVTTEPEKRKKELEAGSLQVKSEKKAPIIHVQVGTAEQKDKEVLENIMALSRRISLGNIRKLTLSSTMSPGVKVDLNSLKTE